MAYGNVFIKDLLNNQTDGKRCAFIGMIQKSRKGK